MTGNERRILRKANGTECPMVIRPGFKYTAWEKCQREARRPGGLCPAHERMFYVRALEGADPAKMAERYQVPEDLVWEGIKRFADRRLGSE